MLELFPDRMFPMETADDRARSKYCYHDNITERILHINSYTSTRIVRENVKD